MLNRSIKKARVHWCKLMEVIEMRRILLVVCLLILLSACAPGQALPDTSAGSSAAERPAAQAQNRTSVTDTPEMALSEPSQAIVPVQNWKAGQETPEIQLVDLLTGEKVKDSPALAGAASALSADGKMLAAVESDGQSCEAYAGGTACRGNASVLHLVDLPVWKDVPVALASKGWASAAAFSPDTSHLALAVVEKEQSTLLIFDTQEGARLAQTGLEIRPQLIRFNQEGTELVVYGQAPGEEPGVSKPAAPRVLRLAVPSLQVVWEQALEAVASGEWCEADCQASHDGRLQVTWGPAVVYAPKQDALYVVHADEERLTTVDFQAQQVRAVEIRQAQSLLERLLALTAGVARAKGPMNGAHKEAVLSPDGKALYVVGRKIIATHTQGGGLDFQEEFLGIQILNPQSGQLIEQRDSQAANIRISPDGVTLFLTGTTGNLGWTEVLSTRDREFFVRLEGWEAVITRQVDGQPAYVALQFGPHRTLLAILDPITFRVTKSWKPSGYTEWITAGT
jgi:hypothetical protein